MPKPTFHNLPAPKQRRLVRAALEEFAARPYGEASLDRVAARARIAKGSLYQYFGGKADLYRYLVLEELGRRRAAALAGVVGGTLFDAITRGENVTVVTLTTVLVLVYIVANLAVDLLYAALDPRIRYA